MTTAITWSVTAMNCSTTEANPDTVTVVHWTCSGTDGTYNASVYSTCSVPTPTDAFTPYQDLTQEQVLGWIWGNGVDKAVTEAAVEAQIQAQITPSIVSPALPWSAA